MQEIMIREAVPDDAKQMLAYVKRIGAETDNLTFGGEGLPISVEDEEKYIQSVQQDDHSVMYVAVENGEIIGNASLSGMPRRMSHRAEMAVSVMKDKWNGGIGSALIQKLIAYAKGHGIEIMNLDVRADNAGAIHVYEKLGFQRIGVSPAFFKIGDEYIDFIQMYLDLR